jgi:hypothetical protein
VQLCPIKISPGIRPVESGSWSMHNRVLDGLKYKRPKEILEKTHYHVKSEMKKMACMVNNEEFHKIRKLVRNTSVQE